jgi:hypothetical protein
VIEPLVAEPVVAIWVVDEELGNSRRSGGKAHDGNGGAERVPPPCFMVYT